MAIPLTKHYVTPEEYYEFERAAQVRHDYYDGEIYDMSGGTIVHSLICANLGGELRSRLKGSPCFALEANLRLRIMATGLRCYPDASVYCGPLERDPQDSAGGTLTNPTVVFEVLSPSTQSYDRGFKSDNYRTIPSLKTYMFVSQTSPQIDVFYRQDDGSWLSESMEGLDAKVSLPAINIELPLKEIYDRVRFRDTGSFVL